MLRFFCHYGIHFIVPFIVAFIFYRPQFWKVSMLLLSAIAIDLDHFLATPLFDATRCSINFHPLHSFYAIGIYSTFLIFRRTRIIGIGLLLHMLADAVDCLFLSGNLYQS